MPYSEDGGKTWIKTDFDYAIDYLENNGWYFPQGEFATKGKMTVYVDIFPCLISNGSDTEREWETLKELKAILEDESFVNI